MTATEFKEIQKVIDRLDRERIEIRKKLNRGRVRNRIRGVGGGGMII